MAELLMALDAGSEPSLCGQDNLKTLVLVEAVRVSAGEHRVVELKEE